MQMSDNQQYVISASRRTDLPAFHLDWFIKSINAGVAEIKHPYSGKPLSVPIEKDKILAIVFWSRWYAHLLKRENELSIFPALFQFTINDYPERLEKATPPKEKAVAQAKELATKHGRHTVLWRYDPIILHDGLDENYHIDCFTKLADSLAGSVQRCSTSFVSLYRKTIRNAAAGGFQLSPIEKTRKVELAAKLARIASERDIQLMACCDPDLLEAGLIKASCVDLQLIRMITGNEELILAPAPTRSGCGCYSSIDLGSYNTCYFGCLYCYANSKPETK